MIVKHYIKIPEKARILGKTRKPVSMFHQSTRLEKQRQFSHDPSSIELTLTQEMTRLDGTAAIIYASVLSECFNLYNSKSC